MSELFNTGLLKPSDVATKLAVSRSWVYEAAADGRIPSLRLGGPNGPIRFVEEDVDRWIDLAREAWSPNLSNRDVQRRASQN